MSQVQVPLATRATPDPFGNPTHRTVGIVDANAILSSVDNDCRNNRNSRLLRSTAFDSTTLYAADHVWEEIYRRLPKIAKSSPVPLADLRARFETRYLPAMRFVTMSAENKPHPRVLAITDLDDRPTGQLALLIAPVIVYSEDKHLKRPGFAPPDWRAAAGYTAIVAEAAGQERATGMALFLPVAGVWSGSGALGRRLGVPRWLPAAALVALLSLGAYRLLLDPARRATAKDVGGEFAEMLFGLLAEQSRLKLAGLAGISNIIFSPLPKETSVRQRVAIVLAHSSDALLVREVHELVVDNFVDNPVPALREVRSTLTDGSEFVCVDRCRWQLGREAAPWPGQYRK
ncbi:MAG: PIN domain-containing protein [Dermatophilaceae bacterium]